MDSNLTFGENLRELRRKAGLTRAQLAEQITYSEKAIEKWEMRNTIPPVATVCKLAKLFCVTVDSLLYSPKKEVNFFLGIDGGGTKTDFLLTDRFGNQVNRVILGPSNAVDIGMENAKAVLEQGIRQVCKGIDLQEVSLFAGLAGGITGKNMAILADFFGSFGFGVTANGSDMDNALQMALDGQDGIAIIMGTGIIAFAQHKGILHRVGGWGYLLDKGGSGYNLGADVLDSALKCSDGRDGSPLLLQLVEEKLKKPVQSAIAEIYRSGKTGISSFAPLAFQAYEAGDPHAIAILRRNVASVAEIIAAGCKHFTDAPVNAVICGGLANRADILAPIFEELTDNTVNVRFTTEPMVNGSVALAKNNCKKEGSSC